MDGFSPPEAHERYYGPQHNLIGVVTLSRGMWDEGVLVCFYEAFLRWTLVGGLGVLISGIRQGANQRGEYIVMVIGDASDQSGREDHNGVFGFWNTGCGTWDLDPKCQISSVPFQRSFPALPLITHSPGTFCVVVR